MTANQLVAICFPLLSLAAVVVVGLSIVKPWSKAARRTVSNRAGQTDGRIAIERRDIEIRKALREADAQIRKAERQLSKAGTP